VATLVVTVSDWSTGNVLAWVHVEVDGMVLTTALDGSCSFGVELGKTYTLKVRSTSYRPFSVAVTIAQDPTQVNVQLQKAVVG
jgi:hypothetical protein